MKSLRSNNEDITASFWQMADITKEKEKYKIDKNLQYLKFAPLDILQKIFVQYRFFTHYYITDLAILISKLPFGGLKTILAEILYEELGSGKSYNAHPILYDDFLTSIGISKASMTMPDPYCIHNLEMIQNSLLNKSWAYGVGLRGMGGECLCQIYLASMHEFFSQNFSIIAIRDRIAWKFWNIHIGEIDLHHQKIIRTAINELVIMEPNLSTDLINGYLESKEAWDRFWEQIFRSARKNHANQKEVLYASE